MDEPFLDLSGIPASLKEYGPLIRQTVLQHTGIPTSIGIAETKTLAKIANKLAKGSSKANGVLDLTGPRWREEALQRTLWGVGRQWTEKLHRKRIHTALDLSRADDQMILKHFDVILMRTELALRGISCRPLPEAPPTSKTIMASLSFGRPVERYEDLRQAVATYAAKSANKMRSEALVATKGMYVFVQTNRFKTDEPQYNNGVKIPLLYPTDTTIEIISAANMRIQQLFALLQGLLSNGRTS